MSLGPSLLPGSARLPSEIVPVHRERPHFPRGRTGRERTAVSVTRKARYFRLGAMLDLLCHLGQECEVDDVGEHPDSGLCCVGVDSRVTRSRLFHSILRRGQRKARVALLGSPRRTPAILPVFRQAGPRCHVAKLGPGQFPHVVRGMVARRFRKVGLHPFVDCCMDWPFWDCPLLSLRCACGNRGPLVCAFREIMRTNLKRCFFLFFRPWRVTYHRVAGEL